MKLLLTKDAMIEHMKQKGIKFNIMSEEQAKMFLTDNNYYMKLASYRTNYEKNCTTGKYKNLDFAYLRELSTIDMRLRYLIIEMSLDMEHAIKVILLNEIESNDREDGYNIIRKFVGNEHNSYILKKIHNHKSSEYSRNLVDKYYPYFPAWVFVELISFGDLTYLCDFYKKEYGTEIIKNKFMNEVRDLRNAAAHSNCLINRLFDRRTKDEQPDIEITGFVKRITDIAPKTRAKNLQYRFSYNIITFLYVYDSVVKSKGIKENRYKELKELFNDRMTRNKEYFKSNSRLVGIYIFLQKIVDKM